MTRCGIIYEGPSLLDGSPIVAIATDPDQVRENPKTGRMTPVYIIRQDVDPITANRTGADAAICGACPLKGTPTDRDRGHAANRVCYVSLHFTVLQVWRAYRAGKYPWLGDDEIRELGRDQTIRAGAYGDPQAIPARTWVYLLKYAKNWTGYTHQRDPLGTWMQSVERLADAQLHWAAGRRTFRVVSDVSEIDKAREVLCPASIEAGKRTQCAKCNLCRGASVAAKSIAVVVHGSGAKNFRLDTASNSMQPAT